MIRWAAGAVYLYSRDGVMGLLIDGITTPHAVRDRYAYSEVVDNGNLLKIRVENSSIVIPA